MGSYHTDGSCVLGLIGQVPGGTSPATACFGRRPGRAPPRLLSGVSAGGPPALVGAVMFRPVEWQSEHVTW